MEGRTQGIAHGMNGGAARIAKGDARVQRGHQEVLQQRHPGLRAVRSDLLVAVQDHINGLVAKHPGHLVALGGKAGFHGMDQGIDGAGSEEAEGQAVQQFGYQHGAVGIHLIHRQALLGAAAVQRQDGNIGHFAASAAGGGHQYQLFILHDLGLAIVEIQDGGNSFQCKKLGNINDGTAADGDNTLMVAFNVLIHGLCHVIGGLASAVFLLIQHIAAEVQLAKEGLVDVFVGDHQVTNADFEFRSEFFSGLKLIDGRFNRKHFHGGLPPFSFLFGAARFRGKDGTDLGIISSIFPLPAGR